MRCNSALRSRPAAEKAAICASVVEHVWPLVADGSVRTLVHTSLPLAEAQQGQGVIQGFDPGVEGLVVLRAVDPAKYTKPEKRSLVFEYEYTTRLLGREVEVRPSVVLTSLLEADQYPAARRGWTM